MSFFCEEKKEVVFRHLVSLNMPSVTTNDIYIALVSHFDKKKIPWEHCLASLMDSCNVVRGSKSGLKKKLHESVCPNLLDIDGDSCHQIHNGCKVFTEVFGKHLEHLFQSVYSDFKWSEDHRNILKDIFFQLGFDVSKTWNVLSHTLIKNSWYCNSNGLHLWCASEILLCFFKQKWPNYKNRIENIEKRR